MVRPAKMLGDFSPSNLMQKPLTVRHSSECSVTEFQPASGSQKTPKGSK